jgi:hypothetical protein
MIEALATDVVLTAGSFKTAGGAGRAASCGLQGAGRAASGGLRKAEGEGVLPHGLNLLCSHVPMHASCILHKPFDVATSI